MLVKYDFKESKVTLFIYELSTIDYKEIKKPKSMTIEMRWTIRETFKLQVRLELYWNSKSKVKLAAFKNMSKFKAEESQ